MKADERKENETNALRQWLAKMATRMEGRWLYTLVGVVVLGAAAIFITMYWYSSRAAARSNRIMEFNSADTEKKLNDLIKSDSHKSHETVIWSKLELARIALYPDGITKLGSLNSKDRNAAIAKVEEGRKAYLDISNEFKDRSAIQQEIWFSLAAAEEVLLGTKKADNEAEYRGSFDKMIEYYGKAAAINPDSEVSKRYAAKAKEMQANRETVIMTYRRLAELGVTPDQIFQPKKGPFEP
ncbi:MAG: hypothetical protein K8T89_25775 [Planctomycetes bacterium]|nr:hypothetical protein [Planctomycetota bacterium]